MRNDEKVTNFTKAQSLKADHDTLKGEIQARDDSFLLLTNMSTAMAQTGIIKENNVFYDFSNTEIPGHYAAAEAVDRCAGLSMKRDELYAAWHMKKVYLDQLVDLHFFLREAKQIENITSTHEVRLGTVSSIKACLL